LFLPGLRQPVAGDQHALDLAELLDPGPGRVVGVEDGAAPDARHDGILDRRWLAVLDLQAIRLDELAEGLADGLVHELAAGDPVAADAPGVEHPDALG